MILERIEKNQEVMYHFKFYKKHAMSLYLTYSLSKISNYLIIHEKYQKGEGLQYTVKKT